MVFQPTKEQPAEGKAEDATTQRFIRVTERQIFQNCRRQWKLGYQEKWVPKHKPPDARDLGTAVHTTLAVYYSYVEEDRARNDSGDLTVTAAEIAMQTWRKVSEGLDLEQYELGTNMLTRYFDYASTADYGWEIVSVERTLTAKIPRTQVTLQGTIDLLVEIRGELWIVDHKTYARLLEPSDVEFDDQLTAYLWLCKQNGINVKGAIYNQMKKKIPYKPGLLLNGKLSEKTVQVDTDYYTYLNTILEYNQDPKDYLITLNKLPKDSFFRRSILTRSDRAIDNFGEYLPAQARDMTSVETVHYPHFTRECKYCDFASICRAMNDGADHEYVQEHLYYQQTDTAPSRTSG